ncbi:MAG TPA: TIGR00730 family Rossman fold protein, partial [Xylanibacter oryzae]|nr:TIGR00730 family Rossman fold protein [Xylanibacter oryzae]
MKKIAVFCSANNNIDPIFAEKTKELGEWIGKNSYTLVNGGCDLGLMESTAQAVHENGGRVIGVVPSKIEKN